MSATEPIYYNDQAISPIEFIDKLYALMIDPNNKGSFDLVEGMNVFNIIKYLSRYPDKHADVQAKLDDIDKAKWYLDHLKAYETTKIDVNQPLVPTSYMVTNPIYTALLNDYLSSLLAKSVFNAQEGYLLSKIFTELLHISAQLNYSNRITLIDNDIEPYVDQLKDLVTAKYKPVKQAPADEK